MYANFMECVQTLVKEDQKRKASLMKYVQTCAQTLVTNLQTGKQT
jgi:hypothetical protein